MDSDCVNYVQRRLTLEQHVWLAHHHRHHNHIQLALHWQIWFGVVYHWQTWNNKHENEQERGLNLSKIIIATMNCKLHLGNKGQLRGAAVSERTGKHDCTPHVKINFQQYQYFSTLEVVTWCACALQSEQDWTCWTDAILTFSGWKHMEAMIQA